MPITRLQSEILKLIASSRDAESFVAGSIPINKDGPRYSRDIDIFHARVELVATAAARDSHILTVAGYTIKPIRQLPAIVSIEAWLEQIPPDVDHYP